MENEGTPTVPDQHADAAARELLKQDNPPRRPDDPRAGGPFGRDQNRDTRDVDAPRTRPENVLELRSQAFSDGSFLPERLSRDGGK